MTALPQATTPHRSLRDRLLVAGIVVVAPAAIISAVSFGVPSVAGATSPAHVTTTHSAAANH